MEKDRCEKCYFVLPAWLGAERSAREAASMANAVPPDTRRPRWCNRRHRLSSVPVSDVGSGFPLPVTFWKRTGLARYQRYIRLSRCSSAGTRFQHRNRCGRTPARAVFVFRSRRMSLGLAVHVRSCRLRPTTLHTQCGHGESYHVLPRPALPEAYAGRS